MTNMGIINVLPPLLFSIGGNTFMMCVMQKTGNKGSQTSSAHRKTN